MVMSCAALGCKNRFTKKANQSDGGSVLTFHKFPSDNPMFPEKVALRQLWHAAVKRPNWTAPRRAVLCSEHFLTSDFYLFGAVTKLRENVVPSVFQPVSTSHHSHQPLKRLRRSGKRVMDPPPPPPPQQPQPEPLLSLDLSNYPMSSAGLAQALRTNLLSVGGKQQELESSSVMRTLALGAPDLQYPYYSSPSVGSYPDPPKDGASLADDLLRYKAKLEESKKKIKTLTEKVRRQEARLKSFDHRVMEMKYEAQDAAEVLSKSLAPGPKQLLRRLALKNEVMSSEEIAYPEELRHFAINLYGISPRAYDFMRESFNKALPSTSRVRQWKHEAPVSLLAAAPPAVVSGVLLPPGGMFHPRPQDPGLLGEL